MKENVIIVNCKVPSEAYQALSMLRQKPEQKGFKISYGAIVKREGGELSLADGFAADGAEGKRGWAGGLIGGLVGLLAGPVGVLIGGGIGALLGNSLGKQELKSAAALLKKACERLGEGETALLLLAEEKDETALAEKLGDFQASFTRMDAEKLATQLKQAKKKDMQAEQGGIDDGTRQAKARMEALYGENKPITDGNYDRSLAVKCVNGTFVGQKKGDVIAYRGIPFVGRQPVGEYRWKAPVDFAPDDGVYEARYFGTVPCQNGDRMQIGSLYPQSEACLYLNVWTTVDRGPEKKPVIVWIHGGACEIGSTAEPREEGTSYVQENQDIVFASLEYRLGVFGFLHLSHLPDGQDYPDAQNLGLMDQMMALKWIHENIAFFGGDPDNVTIIGESAGAGSVCLLPLVEGSRAYFKRMIAQSGSALLTRSVEEAVACTDDLMSTLGCKTVADLRKMDAAKLLEAAGVLAFRIWPERDGSYLPARPFAAYADGAVKDIPILQGCNKDEGGFMAYSMGVEGCRAFTADFKAKLLAQLPEEGKALAESFCRDARDVSYEYPGELRLLEQLLFVAPMFRMSESQTMGGGKSYTYFYTPESSVPLMRCAHTSEISTVFNHPEETFMTGRRLDETFSKLLRRMWIQFAKTGDPSLSADISPDGQAHVWPLYDLENRQVMIFDECNIHPEKEADRQIVDWDRTYSLTPYYCV